MIFFRFWLVYKFGDDLCRNRITSKPVEGNKENSINSIDSRREGKKVPRKKYGQQKTATKNKTIEIGPNISLTTIKVNELNSSV